MKIGLLAYHSACNFGASLQLLSTVCFLQKHGHTPLVINWANKELEEQYAQTASVGQQNIMFAFRDRYWHETRLCRTSEEVAQVIEEQNIQAVIVGSDAVAQHHPALERMVFPCRRIVAFRHVTPDRLFPNPFWGEFNNYLEKPVPVAVISASSQDSSFRLIPWPTRRKMEAAINAYRYLSVRDDWTQQMMAFLTRGKRIPPVTPDPVFAFNQNAGHLLPTREHILQKYELPESYIMLSFKQRFAPPQSWFDSFMQKAHADGCVCVNLPFSDQLSYGQLDITIPHPVSPIDWFALIKYSTGYVGNNMHPIVVSLHNAVPFYSFDNYGRITNRRSGKADETSSKILHILRKADFCENRTFALPRTYSLPSPEDVYLALKGFDREKAKLFASAQYQTYKEMMDSLNIQ